MNPEQRVDETAPRSSVKIEVSAKMVPQLRVACYEGVDEKEMERLLHLAYETLNTGQRLLGQPTFGTR